MMFYSIFLYTTFVIYIFFVILIFMQSLVKLLSVVPEIQMKRAKRGILTYIHTYLLTDQPSHRISKS